MNVHIVNNSRCDIRPFQYAFDEAYVTGVLCEELADLFSITFLDGMNADGSRRMIVTAA